MRQFGFMVLLLICVCPGSRADEYDLTELMRMNLEQLMDITITGSTLSDESIRTVPSAVTVFTHEQISRMGLDALPELLNLVPGYQTQRNSESPFLYSYSARGRRNGSQSKEVLLLIDGRVMNDPRSGGTDAQLRWLPLSQVERVEVIRGPGSALYGSSAYTGVINVITRQGVNEAGLAAGSHDMGKGHVLWSQSQESWQLDMFAEAFTDNGQTYNVKDTFSSGRINTTDPRQSLHFDMALRHDDTVLRALVHQSEGDDFYSLGNVFNDFNTAMSQVNQISLEQEINWNTDFYSHFFMGYLETLVEAAARVPVPPSRLPAGSTDPVLIMPDLQAKSFQFKWHNDWHQSAAADIQFGLEWHHDTETVARLLNNYDMGELAAGVSPITYYGDFSRGTPVSTLGTRYFLGVYGQYLYNLDEATHLTLGLRHDDYDDSGSYTSPRLGVVHALDDTHTVKLLYGEAFRAPTMIETRLINNTVLVGNSGLEHEIVKTWDLIWLGDWQATHSSLGWFRNRYEDPIIRGQIGTTRTFVNGDDEEAQGWELEIQHQLTEQWLLGGAFTHFTKLPDSALREADSLAALTMNFEQASWNWNLAAVYHNSREMLTPGDIPLTLDEYWLLNSKLRYQANKKWQTFIQVKNLLDEEYFSAVEGSSLTEGIANRGREWSVGMNIGFE
ncbi:MAG: outer rane receptor for ferrienterochelin and colicin [Pseudomonadota bacterium]|nr:outer rane receptor for ferrienterochelin and colicin [Pseudomonadota bacterium]